MYSDLYVVIFIITLFMILAFVIWNLKTQNLQLIHKMFLALALCYCAWVIPVIAMRFAPHSNLRLMYFLDCCTLPGAFMPVFWLCVAIIYVKNMETMPKKLWLLFIVPVITSVVTITNPLHHLQYRVFSVIRREITFGPYIFVSGAYTYLMLISGVVLMIHFASRNRSRLYVKQAILFSLGGIIPLIVSILATLGIANLSIAATPLSFVCTVLFNGISIYYFHMLDLKPVATQHILDWISDCYLVLSDKGLVISFNQPFASVFASRYGIAENQTLHDCLKEEDISGKTAIYNIITAVEACREAGSVISYEQAVTIPQEQGVQKCYYITDVSPLVINHKLSGFAVIFKDVTQLKKSMQQLQDSQTRMMEQERLAFLGQMIGGLAHNLKTPIMSISGCVSALDALVDECEESLSDPQVVPEDYQEIYGEMRDWFQKTREATSYMSDIITAIKEQAATVTTYRDSVFTVDELLKRTTLLMRHELFLGGCQLVTEYSISRDISLQGDINSLIQVLNNLLSNAIYSQKMVGGGTITLGFSCDGEYLNISVRDTGQGISPSVRRRLFKEMVTSKGTHGTGLGLYISDTAIRGKFGGHMWAEDNPEGGAIFGISIPLSRVTISETEQPKGGISL